VLEQQDNDPSLRQSEAGESDPRAHGSRPPGDVLAGDTFTGDIVTGISVDDIGSSPAADWVDAQLGRIELLLCASAAPASIARLLLLDLAPLVRAVQGAAYVLERGAEQLALAASYAAGDGLPDRVAIGEGLLGQCAASRRKLVVSGVSNDYFRVRSGLGSSAPAVLVFVPVTLEAGALAVLELAFLARGLAVDVLLERLAQRPPRGESPTADPLDSPLVTPGRDTGARELAAAPGPSTTARHGFWSTLSHELRSPLNSVIVLSQVLAENGEHNLSDKQVNLARVIHGSGKDLLALVDTVALLAKIEARRLVLSPGELELDALERRLSRTFEPLARARGLHLSIELEPGAPRAILTDPVRARQVVECMLVTAIERADGPVVRLRIGGRQSGWSSDRERLASARAVLAFVVDGVEAFERPGASPGAEHISPSAGGASSRVEGDEPDAGLSTLGVLARGGVLGLAISGELAGWLGGELRQDGASARLTLYLPVAGSEPLATLSGRVTDADRDQSRRSTEVAENWTGSMVEPERERERSSTAAPRAGELEGLELLLVDPDVRQAFTLTGHLERQGAVVAHADELSEALDRLRGRRLPSAVLIDARLLRASPEPSVQRLLRLAEQTPCVVLRQPGDDGARLPQVFRSSIAADAREVVALLRRVAVGPGSLQNRAR